MNAADLALLLHEANFAPWESVQSALGMGDGATHPRVGWLTAHLTQTKRAYWAAIAGATGCPPSPDDAGLRRLMAWEVEQTRRLSPEQLSTELTYSEQAMTVAELLRLNARHSVWHAGQLAALAGRTGSA